MKLPQHWTILPSNDISINFFTTVRPEIAAGQVLVNLITFLKLQATFEAVGICSSAEANNEI